MEFAGISLQAGVASGVNSFSTKSSLTHPLSIVNQFWSDSQTYFREGISEDTNN